MSRSSSFSIGGKRKNKEESIRDLLDLNLQQDPTKRWPVREIQEWYE